MENTKLPLTIWFLAMQLLPQAKNNVAALELMRHLGVCRSWTAGLFKHEVLEVLRQREEGRQLTGRIEMDDADLGGGCHGGTTGRGSENKVSFVPPVLALGLLGHHVLVYCAFVLVLAVLFGRARAAKAVGGSLREGALRRCLCSGF